tara:strand:+ start:264 stop:440 length:177 start_codon:yes stop_codon:yes gene_type:complete
MKLFKKIIKSYLVFGLGVIFGSTISAIVTYSIMMFAYGTPDAIKILQIQECLEEKINE